MFVPATKAVEIKGVSPTFVIDIPEPLTESTTGPPPPPPPFEIPPCEPGMNDILLSEHYFLILFRQNMRESGRTG
jgi:hypothetical protein